MNLGLSADEFWQTTPAEYNGFCRALAKRRDSEVDLARAASYWTEALARTKRLPDFKGWMNPPKPARHLDGEEAARRLAEHEDDVARSRDLRAKRKAKTEEGQRADG